MQKMSTSNYYKYKSAIEAANDTQDKEALRQLQKQLIAKYCPICGWEYPGPLLIKGDFAPTTKCQKCGHVGLVRNK